MEDRIKKNGEDKKTNVDSIGYEEERPSDKSPCSMCDQAIRRKDTRAQRAN